MLTRDFNPDDDLIRVPIYALKDIQDKGFAYIQLPSGHTIKIIQDDLLFKKEEIEEYLRKKNETI